MIRHFTCKNDSMIDYQENIENQFKFNEGKNLFFNGVLKALKFSPETLKAIDGLESMDAETENLWIDYLTDRAIQEFCKINQYYRFDKSAWQSLRSIYADLLANLKSRTTSIEMISEKHFGRLKNWLRETNAFAQEIYQTKGEIVEPVVCKEYSADLQLEILQLDVQQISEPILDIGCGKQGNLVHYLRQKGLDACGFDRFAFDYPFLGHSDWFEFTFERDKWGTIISNLGFSNHFQHHHFRKDGNFMEYAKKYMGILNALKIGGCFHYAPDLPFIEQYLDREKYQLIKRNIGGYEFQSTKIIRKK